MSQLKDRAGMQTDEVSERGLQTWQQTDEKPYELHTGDGRTRSAPHRSNTAYQKEHRQKPDPT